MVSRFAGVGLGLLAFSVTALSGLYVQNPVDVTLSRSVFALFLFYVLGLVLGGVADQVVAEYARDREAQIKKQFQVEPESDTEQTAADSTLESQAG